MIVKSYYYHKNSSFKKGVASNIGSVWEHYSGSGYSKYLKRQPRSVYKSHAENMNLQARATNNEILLEKAQKKLAFINSDRQVDYATSSEDKRESNLYVSLVISDNDFDSVTYPKVYLEQLFYQWMEVLPKKWRNKRLWDYYGAYHQDSNVSHFHLVVHQSNYAARRVPLSVAKFQQIYSTKRLEEYKKKLIKTSGFYPNLKNERTLELLKTVDYSKLEPYSNPRHMFLCKWFLSYYPQSEWDPRQKKIYQHKNWSAPIRFDNGEQKTTMSLAAAHKAVFKHKQELRQKAINELIKSKIGNFQLPEQVNTKAQNQPIFAPQNVTINQKDNNQNQITKEFTNDRN